MKMEYKVDGMTCGGCLASVQRALESIDGVQSASVSLEDGTVNIVAERSIAVTDLQDVLGSKYKIDAGSTQATFLDADALPSPSLTTYKPLIIIVGYLLLVSALAQYPFSGFSWMTWMRYFMAGFFLAFSFFKMLNLSGFASSYAMYDIVAARWYGYGYVYPFIELVLGILYLTNTAPFWTNIATIIVLGVSAIGVIISNLNHRKIKCACLGDVFNLPMSTVTIIEDVGMVAMALVMLLM